MIRLAVRVRREEAELVLAELLELAPGGVEERDRGDGTVEYAVYGSPGELPELPGLRAAAGAALVAIDSAEVPDDWAERWREFHRPLRLGDRMVVRPPWEPGPADAAGSGDTGAPVDIVIDPGQAFGTGAHATTRLCLQLLLDLRPGGAFADLGCGSGVLAIAAAKLGWAPVAAVDHDPLSLDATRANAAANGVRLDVARADLRRGPGPPARTVAANLLRPLLLDVAAHLAGPPDDLIASGLLLPECDEVAAAFERHGLHERRRVSAGDWAALLLGRRRVARAPGGVR